MKLPNKGNFFLDKPDNTWCIVNEMREKYEYCILIFFVVCTEAVQNCELKIILEDKSY